MRLGLATLLVGAMALRASIVHADPVTSSGAEDHTPTTDTPAPARAATSGTAPPAASAPMASTAGDGTPRGEAPATVKGGSWNDGPSKGAGTEDIAPAFDHGPLDIKLQSKEYALSVARSRSRLTSSNERTDGWDFVLTTGLAPRLPWLRVSGQRGVVFRVLDSKTFSFTPFFQGLEGGLRLGFLELGADIGVSAMSVDVSHAEWSVGFLQPRTSAVAGLRFQEFHVRAVAFSEFYWRWFGQDNALVQGIGVQFVIGMPNR